MSRPPPGVPGGPDRVVRRRGPMVVAADAGAGSGLTGLADRVGAQGGALSVSSPPGDGTTIRAVLPLDGAARPTAVA